MSFSIPRFSGISCALLAAILFGASTPFAKAMLGGTEPLVLAGLFYAGSGVGLGCWLLVRWAAATTRSAVDIDGAASRPDTRPAALESERTGTSHGHEPINRHTHGDGQEHGQPHEHEHREARQHGHDHAGAPTVRPDATTPAGRETTTDPALARTGFARADIPWLAGAIAAGGIAGPLLLLTGLGSTPASTASLLLNLEGVFTALLAWFVFKEHFDRKILIGMGLIVSAGVLLSSGAEGMSILPGALPWGALCIAGACLCWALDNNLTRKVSANDAVQIAALKGLVSGLVNLALAWQLGLRLPSVSLALGAGLVGFCGYGLSLVLFVVALRQLGSARTGAYFSAAPFVGAALSIVMLGDRPGWIFGVATLLMAAGLWLHLAERHRHRHRHDPMQHGHAHAHDRHHQHEHRPGDAGLDGLEQHSHPHSHPPLEHEHVHFPDIHHRHTH